MCSFCTAGTYTIDISPSGNTFIRCAYISLHNEKDAVRLEKIITCSDVGYIFGKKVLFSSSDEKHLQIYELNIIGKTEWMLIVHMVWHTLETPISDWIIY